MHAAGGRDAARSKQAARGLAVLVVEHFSPRVDPAVGLGTSDPALAAAVRPHNVCHKSNMSSSIWLSLRRPLDHHGTTALRQASNSPTVMAKCSTSSLRRLNCEPQAILSCMHGISQVMVIHKQTSSNVGKSCELIELCEVFELFDGYSLQLSQVSSVIPCRNAVMPPSQCSSPRQPSELSISPQKHAWHKALCYYGRAKLLK